jgi:hypothetical protein
LKRGCTPHRLNIAERRGVAPHSQPSKRAATTPQKLATEKEEAAVIPQDLQQRGRSNTTRSATERPQQGDKYISRGAAARRQIRRLRSTRAIE